MDGSLKARIGECHAELNKIADEYEIFYLRCESLKDEKIASYKKKINSLIKERHSSEYKKLIVRKIRSSQ